MKMKRKEYRTKIKRPPYIPIGPSIAIVPLTQNQEAIIDIVDLVKVAGKNWNAHYDPHTKGYYVRGYRNGQRLNLHWLIANPENGMQVDHRNGNSLDNRRTNLRIVTLHQNEKNKKHYANSKSGLKGVYVTSNGMRWMGQIRVDSELIYLGTFDSPEEAYEAYKKAAEKYFGEYRRQIAA
jgi:hypothetical protein